MIEIPGLIKLELKQLLLPIIYIVVGMIIYEIIKKAILKLSASNSKLRKSQKHRLQTVNLLIINIIKV